MSEDEKNDKKRADKSDRGITGSYNFDTGIRPSKPPSKRPKKNDDD